MRGKTSKASTFDLVKVVVREDRGDLKSKEKAIWCVTGNIFNLECLLL